MTVTDVNQHPSHIEPYSKEIELLIAEASLSRVRLGVIGCFHANEESSRTTDNYITCADEAALVGLLVDRMKPTVTRKQVADTLGVPVKCDAAWKATHQVNTMLVRKVIAQMRAEASLWKDEGSNRWTVRQSTVELLQRGKARKQPKRDTHVFAAVRQARGSLAYC